MIARAADLSGGPPAARVRALDVETHVLRSLAYQRPQDFPILLDSAASGPLGRYSILAAFPQGRLWQDAAGTVHQRDLGLPPRPGFLQSLQAAWQAQRVGRPACTPDWPFQGGWMVFLGYELAAEIEPQLRLPRALPGAAPAAFALRVPSALILDHRRQRVWALAEPGHEALLDALEQAARQAPRVPAECGSVAVTQLIEEPADRFQQQVQCALESIRAGDIYQANLSRAWSAHISGQDACALLYERLRARNPSPFAALAQHPGWSLLSSSPERLVRVCERRVETRPIAGTHARGGSAAHELAALVAHPKERAEHIMLIDLERNDLGRICEAGSVQVDEYMHTESYAHVHHIVSNVCGRLRPGLTPVQVLAALFPGGTITGCPKIRCMQIIAGLEAQARGAYTGALGYINHDGSMDFNILIRSLTVCGDRLEFRAGAGIVADSDWQRELAETRAKARGMLAALRA